MAYATVEDLEKRWRKLTPSERTTAETMLDDASVIIDTYVKGDADFNLLGIITCNMVRRAMDPDTIANTIMGDSGWEPQKPAARLMPEWDELKMLKSASKVGFAKMSCL